MAKCIPQSGPLVFPRQKVDDNWKYRPTTIIFTGRDNCRCRAMCAQIAFLFFIFNFYLPSACRSSAAPGCGEHAVCYSQSAASRLVIRVIPSGQLSFIVNPEDQKTPLFPFFHIIHHSSFKIQHSSFPFP
jgi:hypothetical protein